LLVHNYLLRLTVRWPYAWQTAPTASEQTFDQEVSD